MDEAGQHISCACVCAHLCKLTPSVVTQTHKDALPSYPALEGVVYLWFALYCIYTSTLFYLKAVNTRVRKMRCRNMKTNMRNALHITWVIRRVE